MHISYDCIATKTCPSYEFLVVFGQVQVWDRKSAGLGTGWDGLRGRCRLEVCGSGQNFSKYCGCGAGRVWILQMRGGPGHKISTRTGL